MWFDDEMPIRRLDKVTLADPTYISGHGFLVSAAADVFDDAVRERDVEHSISVLRKVARITWDIFTPGHSITGRGPNV